MKRPQVIANGKFSNPLYFLKGGPWDSACLNQSAAVAAQKKKKQPCPKEDLLMSQDKNPLQTTNYMLTLPEFVHPIHGVV